MKLLIQKVTFELLSYSEIVPHFQAGYLKYFYWFPSFDFSSHSGSLLWHLIFAFPVHSCMKSEELFSLLSCKGNNLWV